MFNPLLFMCLAIKDYIIKKSLESRLYITQYAYTTFPYLFIYVLVIKDYTIKI